MGSTLLALDARLDLERNFAGNRDWAFRIETAKPACIVCLKSVQVKDNRKFLLERKGEMGVAAAGSEPQRSAEMAERKRRGKVSYP